MVEYVLEWLKSSWNDVLLWPNTKSSRAHLYALHEEMRKLALGQPSFVYKSATPFTARRCQKPGEWQVQIDETGEDNSESHYFFVRESGGLHFDLVGISVKPFAGCLASEPSVKYGMSGRVE